MNSHKLTETVSDIIQEQLHLNNKISLHVISNSMKPLIQVGDQIIVESVTYHDLLPGDIIFFKKGENYCTHRYVGRFNDGKVLKVITKGDHFKYFDLPVHNKNIHGKTIKILRGSSVIDLQTYFFKTFHRFYCYMLKFQWKLFNRKSWKKTSNNSQFFRVQRALVVRWFHVINYVFSYLLFIWSHFRKNESVPGEYVRFTMHEHGTNNHN